MILTHGRSSVAWVAILLVGAVISGPVLPKGVLSEEPRKKAAIEDVTISWNPSWWEELGGALGGDQKNFPNVTFYVNERFVGFDVAGLESIIKRIGQLPPDTSVVWSSDPGFMISGSGSEEITPKALWPQLWEKLQRVAADRKVPLSSLLYADVRNLRLLDRHDVEYVEPGTAKRPDETILSWKNAAGQWPIYAIDGREVGRGPQGFLDALEKLRQQPAGSRLRVRPGLPPDFARMDLTGPDIFPLEFQDVISDRKLHLVKEKPKKEWPPYANCQAECRWEWRNFVNAATPHADVVYLIDGKLAGCGDAGFDAVLAKLRQLPAGAYIEYPKYSLHPKAYSSEDREKFDKQDLSPFLKRRAELAAVIKERQLVVQRGFGYLFFWPAPRYHNAGNSPRKWYLDSLLSFATIIRDEKKPQPAAAVISWKQASSERNVLPPPAEYSVNNRPAGQGTRGFLAVLKQLEALPDGAIVRIDPVRIRTHAPFGIATIMPGHRHFEVTGSDPFHGLVDLLGEVSRRKRLRVELIPDEGPRNYPYEK